MSTKPVRINEESYQELAEFSEEHGLDMKTVVAGILDQVDLDKLEPSSHFSHHVGRCPECNEPVPSTHVHTSMLDGAVHATCPDAEKLDTEHEGEGVHRIGALREL
jgi:hypothetical protein